MQRPTDHGARRRTTITAAHACQRPSRGRTARRVDPVCGMTVDPHTTPHRHEHQRPHLLFLLGRLPHQVRRRSGELSLAGEARAAEPVPEGTIYTCPMHPEIRQVGPGACPICGMALEPEIATADDRPQSRARRHDAAVLDRARADRCRCSCWRWAAHLVGAARAGSARRCRTGCSSRSPRRWCCGPAGRSSCAAGSRCVTRNLNMFTLIAMGTGVAWLYSVVATLAPGLFPAAFRGHDGAVAVYFEAAAVITVLVLLGQVLELRAREADLRRDPRAARPRAEDRAARRRRRQRRGGAARRRSRSATGCACGRARRCRSTARWSKAARRSTNRW